MKRHAPRFSVVLTLLLSLQWVTAFAHCLAALAPPGAPGHAIEICSAEGIRTLLVGEDGQPASPAPHHHDSCPLCPGSVSPAPEAPGLAARMQAWLPSPPPRLAGLPPAAPRAPPQQPRAPPLA
jgi:hypothetical protein